MQRHLVAPLSSTRSILHLTGPEAPKFLQGLVTNDVIVASNPSKTVNAVYAGFLSAPGRVLHDTFILPCPPSSPNPPPASSSAAPPVVAAPPSSVKPGPITAPPGTEYLIDFPVHSTSPPLPSYVKRYILRSKVKSKLVDDQWRLWAVFQNPLRAIQASRQHDELASPSAKLEEELQSIAGESKGKWWRDRRNRGMGYRLLLPESATAAIQGE
jgi:folate-binding Fe-S cluster repair protein YgfZ